MTSLQPLVLQTKTVSVDVGLIIGAVGVATRPDDGVANDSDDGAADVPIGVVTLDVSCSVLLYNL